VGQFSRRCLTWWLQHGIGYYPVEAGHAPYDQDYFDSFDRNAQTELGRALLANVREWVFVSLPIFRDAEHALRSKHFKPDEHCWYFTRNGLVFAMQTCGFALVSESNVETDLGREDIGTFAFRRVSDDRL
jgi:hypothetical protein